MSTKTGTKPFWMIGLTVVGNAAATVITSSPGRKALSFNSGAVKHESAKRFADEPEFTRSACFTPRKAAKSRSKAFANRPLVSQKSREAWVREQRSWASKTFVEAGIRVLPGTKSAFGNAA